MNFLFTKNKAKLSDMAPSREWHSTDRQWETDFGQLDPVGTGGSSSSSGSGSGSGDAAGAMDVAAQHDAGPHLVLVGTHVFDRCPISDEQFEPVWDEGKQSQVYEGAAVVLIPHKALRGANSSLKSVYETKAQPVEGLSGTAQALLRVAVVKWSVVDILFAKGVVLGFEDAVGRSRQIDNDLALALVEAREKLDDSDAAVFVYHFADGGDAVSEAK